MPKPPSKHLEELSKEVGEDVYVWYISDEESQKLSKLFGQDFKEIKMIGTRVNSPLKRCQVCFKWHEFYDWCVDSII